MDVLGTRRWRISVYHIGIEIRKPDCPQILFEIRFNLPRSKKPLKSLAGFIRVAKVLIRNDLEHTIS